MKPMFLTTLIISTTICLTDTANILVFIPNSLYSHINNFMPIFKELAARGHNVTLASTLTEKEHIPNLNYFVLRDSQEEVFGKASTKNLLELDGVMFRLFGLWLLGLTAAPIALKDPKIQHLIQDTNSKFDLIILETWFIQEIFVAFGHKFNAPVINIMPTTLFPQGAHLTGNALPCTYIPTPKLGGLTDRMTFLERATNCLYYGWDVFIGELYYLKQLDSIMRKYFKYPGSENLPPLVDMLKNTSLTLTDYATGIGYPTPFHKNVIEFGGLSIRSPEKLPNDLQSFMDKAKDGVIYFSFGSHASVSYLKPEQQKAIILALGKVKQKVLMKLEDNNEFRNYTNSNILVKSWFPQPSVIAHPNCKLFITHGGLHAAMEAINNAVPMVVLPLFGDQPHNAKFVEKSGSGFLIKPNEITEDTITYAINHVLDNPSYRKSIKVQSAIFKDRPINTMSNVIYWIEYVIRHKGAPHLRPAVLDLEWYQRLMLDVFVFYLLILGILVFVLKIIFKLLFICIKILILMAKGADKDKMRSKRE